MIGGAAARADALDLRTKMFKMASRMLEVLPTELEAEEGRIFVRDAPDSALTFAEVWTTIQRARIDKFLRS